MFKDFMKRFVPFVLALKVGLLLVWLVTLFGLPLRDARNSLSFEPEQSRTWLVIKELPALNYTEQEALAKGATKPLRVRVLLDVDGTVSAGESRLPPTLEFADDAMRAALHIKFRPATVNGKPIPLWVTVEHDCSGGYSGHRYVFQCDARIVEVERDWRTIYE